MLEVKENTKRSRRSAEERIAEIDSKILFHQNAIQRLEEKKQSVLKPRTSQTAIIKNILAKAKESGMSMDEIAERLGVEV